jgi:uncharacterized protein
MLLMCLNFTVTAQTTWTVKTVPNTRLQSNDIHVSDPDGYLSDSIEMTINTALCAIRDKADVFVVTLASIGDARTKSFVTELFNYWGIGDAEKDNGVLLLFVEDQHALEFETGYGAEETLTDAKCQRIFTNTIVPFFKAGDYEGGLCAGIADIVEVYGGEIPMGLKSTLPAVNYDDEDQGLGDDVPIFFVFFALVLFVMPIVGIVFWRKQKPGKKSDTDTYQAVEEGGATYVDGFKTTWSGSPWEGKGCLGGLTLGFSIFVILFLVIGFMTVRYPNLEKNLLYNRVSIITLLLYLTWVCFRHNYRVLKTAKTLAKQSINPRSVYQAAFENKGNRLATWMAPWLGWIYHRIYKKQLNQSEECTCPQCSGPMKEYAGFSLPENHLAEERVGALKFTPYRCGNGHVVVVKEHGSKYSKFETCPKCGAYTMMTTDTKTIKANDYSHDGELLETCVCQHCGETLTKTVVIPKLVHYSDSSGSYSGSGKSYSSHSSSHHSSSGSFGGGHSGGGGYSGKW